MSRHLRLSPWAGADLRPDEVAGIHARSAALGALVVVTASGPGGPYTVHASDRSVTESRYHANGPLARLIHVVLDGFVAQREQVTRELEALAFPSWTPEELVQIASQSGIEVRR